MIEKITGANFYNNKTLLKSLKFVSEKSPIFTAGASLLFQSTLRPVSTLLAPKTDKEDKKISFVKSLSSALTGFLFMSLFSNPFAKAVKNIDKNPKSFLSEDTIKNLSEGLDSVSSSKSYKFITQLFKLGLGILLAYPKAFMNNKIIPPVMNKISEKKERKPSFTGKIENIIADTINNKSMQKIAKKMQKTDYPTHLMALGDIFSTLAFASITSKNKKLDNRQKKVLNYNALISTGLCLLMGYGLNFAAKKPTESLIKNLEKFNKNSPDLAKYKEGLKIVKSSLIFGSVYYGLIPLISTHMSSKLADRNCPKPEYNL